MSMQRYDLRHLKENFLPRMEEILGKMSLDEVAIFLFEEGDFSAVTKATNRVLELGEELMNSIKYNQVDWTMVIKKRSN